MPIFLCFIFQNLKNMNNVNFLRHLRYMLFFMNKRKQKFKAIFF